MPQFIYLNTAFLDMTQASINIADRGFLLGDGLFETLRADQGKIAYLKEHYARLANAGQYLKIRLPASETSLRDICETLLEKNELTQTAALRITLSRGISERGIGLPTHEQSTLLITAVSYTPPTKPMTACVTNILRNEHSPLCQLKTLNYLENILARQAAKDQGYDEGILLNTQQQIVETSVANLFFKIDGILVTPSLSSGALPGILRQQVLRHCEKHKIPHTEKALSIEEIKTATHAFQTNSLIGLQPIVSIGLNGADFIGLSGELPINFQ